MKNVLSVIIIVALILCISVSVSASELPKFDENKTVVFRYDSSIGMLTNGNASVNAYIDTTYSRLVIKDSGERINAFLKSLEEDLNSNITVEASAEDLFFVVNHKPYKGINQSGYSCIRALNYGSIGLGLYKLWAVDTGEVKNVKTNEIIGGITLGGGADPTIFTFPVRFALENLGFRVGWSSDNRVIVGLPLAN